MKGIYVLILRMKESKDISVGKLGRLHFRRGYYSYVGSAQGSGGDKRITRHFNVAHGKNHTRKWHIDYLLPHSEVICAVFSPTDEDLECVVAKILGKYCEALKGFGCSDCKCASHLFFSGGNIMSEASDICKGVSGNESIIIYPPKEQLKIDAQWRFLNMKNKEKHLKNADVILNLDEIIIDDLDSFWSSGCSGKASFYINCHTEHGYCEDPDLIGKIKILDAKKCDENGVYLLKVKFDKKEEEYYIEG